MKKAILTAAMFVTTFFAATAGSHLPGTKDKDISITSLGVSNGEMSFNLKYENVNEDKLNIVLSDEHGMVLYKETVENKNVSKTFKTSADIGTIIVTVTNTKDKTRKKFEISNEKRYVEELLITSKN